MPALTPTALSPAALGPVALAPVVPSADPASVTINLPGSDLIAADDLFLGGRRALPGGSAARSWFSFVHSSVGLVVVDYAHGGSSADPTVHVAALSAATRVAVDLGSTARTPAAQASLTITALASAGVSSTANGGALTVNGATGLTIGPASTHTNITLRGMRGMQRNGWGNPTYADNNQEGGTNGTGVMYLGQLGTAGRCVGLYIWAHSGFTPRLTLFSGPAYSTSPGEMTVLAQGVAPAIPDSGSGGWAYVTFEAVAFGASDHLWLGYSEDDTPSSGPMYRGGSETPAGLGDFAGSQSLLWDTTRDSSNSSAFGATYTPTVNATYGIYVAIGALVEHPDGNGDYPADGSVTIRVGFQLNSTTHGTRFDATDSILDPETTHHPHIAVRLTNIAVRSFTRQGYTTITADDDSLWMMYGPWADRDYPPTTPPALLGSQLMGLETGDAGTAITVTLDTPIPIGTDVLGADAVISDGYNYITTEPADPGTPTELHLDVYLDTNFTTDGTGSDCWLDLWNGGAHDTDPWCDYIYEASGVGYSYAEVEYRTTGGSMPHTSTEEAAPDPLETDGSPGNPAAIAADYYIATKPGMTT